MAYVQSDIGSNASTSALPTAGIATTTGNFLAVLVSVDNGPKTVTSITDTFTNTWVPLTGNPQSPSGVVNVYGYYAKNITGGASHIVTANLSGASNASIIVMELSGRDVTSPIDFQSAFTESTSVTSHVSASTGTLPSTGDDVICLAADDLTAIFGGTVAYAITSSGWILPAGSQITAGATVPTGFIAYSPNVSTASQQATWTAVAHTSIASSWIVAVKAASGGGGAVAGPMPRQIYVMP